jgi:hypothetical protein
LGAGAGEVVVPGPAAVVVDDDVVELPQPDATSAAVAATRKAARVIGDSQGVDSCGCHLGRDHRSKHGE